MPAGMVTPYGPYIIPTGGGGGGGPTISSVWISHSSITTDDVVTLKVITSGTTTGVVAVIGSRYHYLLETGNVSGEWNTKKSGWNIGVGNAQGITFYAFNTSGIAYDNSLSITVTATGYLHPMQFTKTKLITEWTASNTDNTTPQFELIYDRKRIDRAITDFVIVKEKDRKRDIRGRGQHKDIKYPVIIEVKTTHSEERFYKLWTEVVRIIELDWNFLESSTDYDYVEWADDGVNASMGSAKVWKMIYTINFVRIYKEVGL